MTNRRNESIAHDPSRRMMLDFQWPYKQHTDVYAGM